MIPGAEVRACAPCVFSDLSYVVVKGLLITRDKEERFSLAFQA